MITEVAEVAAATPQAPKAPALPQSVRPQAATPQVNLQQLKGCLVILAVLGGFAFVMHLFQRATSSSSTTPSSYTSSSTTTSSSSDTYSSPISVSADQLYREYSDNEIAADTTYKNKSVVVSGTVKSLGKDILGSPYVVLDAGFLLGVQCVFSRSDTSLARVSKGDSISVRGRVSGKMGNVVVRDCALE